MQDVSWVWHPGDFAVVLVIALLTVGFVAYWFIAESENLRQKMQQRYGKEPTLVGWVLFQKMTGVFFLGLVPLVVASVILPFSWQDYGLGFQHTGTSLLWVFGLSCFVFPLNINAARRPQNLAYYPMMRIERWSITTVLLNALATTAYLLAYELLFRGILLTVCVHYLGVWPAVAINIALYSTTHLPKGPAETIGAIPFGLLVCYITLTIGTIWVAVVIHVILSLSNDYLSLYYHPDMRVVRKKYA